VVPISTLRNLCVLRVSAVYMFLRVLYRRGAEDAELTQSSTRYSENISAIATAILRGPT